MPRKSASPKVAKPKALLSRPEVVGLCKRILKPGSYDPIRDTMVLYRLLKQFPTATFWLEYTLDWQPDSMTYFLGKHGQARLTSDYAIFNLHLPAPEIHKLEDTKVGEDVVIEKKVRTVADLLR